MVAGRNNREVGLTKFQNKEMTGLSFGTQKSGRGGRMVGSHSTSLEETSKGTRDICTMSRGGGGVGWLL